MRPWPSALPVVWLMVLGAGLSSACKSSGSSTLPVPDGGLGEPEAGACTAPPSASPPACAGCLAARCCANATHCAGDADCVAIEECLAGEGSADACAAGHAAGVWMDRGLDVCRQNLCAAECGVPAPTCGAITPDPPSCLAAVEGSCCQETSACGRSDACVALVYQCLDQNGCGTAGPCYDDCRARYPDALPAFDAMVSCWDGLTC